MCLREKLNFRFTYELTNTSAIRNVQWQGEYNAPLPFTYLKFILNYRSLCTHIIHFYNYLIIPASLAGAGDIETHRVRPSVRLSVRPDEFVQAISQ